MKQSEFAWGVRVYERKASLYLGFFVCQMRGAAPPFNGEVT